MPTIELSDDAYARLIFLSAQIGHPMEKHCVQWLETRIRHEPADSEIAESYFHDLVEYETIVPGEPFTAISIGPERWDDDAEAEAHLVGLAIGYGVSTGRLRDTHDGYLLVGED